MLLPVKFDIRILLYRRYPSDEGETAQERSDGLGCADLMMKNGLPKNIIFHEYHVKKI